MKCLHVIPNAGTSDTSMAINRHEVTNRDNDLLNLLSQFTGWGQDQGLAGLNVGIYLLKHGDGECCSLSSTRLSLSNNIRSCEKMLDQVQITVIDLNVPLMTGIIARCWIADGRSKPYAYTPREVSKPMRLPYQGTALYNLPRKSSAFKAIESKESVTSS